MTFCDNMCVREAYQDKLEDAEQIRLVQAVLKPIRKARLARLLAFIRKWTERAPLLQHHQKV